jgi:MFS family permease
MTADAVRAVAMRPALFRLVAALVLRWVGMAMAMVAYLVVAYSVGGAFGVALVTIARTAPVALVAPFAGQLSARLGPERVMVGAYATRAIATIAATLAIAAAAPFWLVIVTAGLSAATGALIRPLHNGILPTVAQRPSELIAANLASSTGEAFGTLLGPALGGLLLATAGPAATLAAASVVALVAFLLAASARATVEVVPSAYPGRDVHTLRLAVSTLHARRGAALIVSGFAFQTVVRGLLTTLLVVASFELLGLGDGGVGLLNASIGIGAVIGALATFGTFERRSSLPAAFVLALAAWGLPIAFIGLAPVLPIAILALGLLGLSNTTVDVAGFTLLQRTVPSAARLPVLGLLEGLVGLCITVGSLLSPLVIEVVGIRAGLLATGAIMPIVAVVIWPALSRERDIAVIPERQLNLLRRVPLFHALSLATLEELARSATSVAFDDDDILMKEGDVGDRYVVLLEGQVEVTQGGRRLRMCGPGDGLGEIALLRTARRTATVRAVGPVRACALNADEFIGAVSGHRVASARAAAIIDDRLAVGAD